jgi:hypothetical protein
MLYIYIYYFGKQMRYIIYKIYTLRAPFFLFDSDVIYV